MGNTIVIDLDNSLYAHSFQNDKQIHQKDLDKAFEKFKNMIQEELAFYKEYYSSDEEEFELDTNIDDDKATEFYWNYKYINDYYVHTFLDLKIKEIL